MHKKELVMPTLINEMAPKDTVFMHTSLWITNHKEILPYTDCHIEPSNSSFSYSPILLADE